MGISFHSIQAQKNLCATKRAQRFPESGELSLPTYPIPYLRTESSGGTKVGLLHLRQVNNLSTRVRDKFTTDSGGR